MWDCSNYNYTIHNHDNYNSNNLNNNSCHNIFNSYRCTNNN